MTQNYDLIVIGEGVSALTCAGHAARAGLRVATFEGDIYGGLVLNVQDLDGYPGAQSGTNLATELMRAGADAGVASIQEEVTAVRASGGVFEVGTAGGAYGARQVVIASGAKLKHLGVPGESEFQGRGVSNCADCDGPMYRNEDVIVVGGGDSAVQEALVLAQFCRNVRVVLRGERLRARKHLADRAAAEPKISVIRNTTVEAILGGDTVEKVRVKRDGNTEEVATAGVFVYVGLAPNAQFAPAGIARDADGHLTTNDEFETSMRGVWAVGAVRAGYSGLLRDAAAEARSAADAVRNRLD